MCTPILLVYGAGLIISAVVLLSPQRYRHDRLMNAGSILLWPIYWSYYLALLLLNKKHS
jgi:hypothetical protein